MLNHTNYSKFPDGEEPVTRTFCLSKSDWDKLLSIREQLLASHGIKLSMNATFIHVLHLHEKHQEVKA